MKIKLYHWKKGLFLVAVLLVAGYALTYIVNAQVSAGVYKLSHSNVVFGRVGLGNIKTEQVKLILTGESHPDRDFTATTTGLGFSVSPTSSVNVPNGSVLGAEFGPFTVTFQPAAIGEASGTLTLTASKGGTVTLKIPLRGTGISTALSCPSVTTMSPASGSTSLASAWVNFGWGTAVSSVAGTIQYKLYVDNDETDVFSSDSTDTATQHFVSGVLSSRSYTMSGLKPGVKYAWGVKVMLVGTAHIIYCPLKSRLFFSTPYDVATTGTGGAKKEFPVELFQYDGRVILNPPPGFEDVRSSLPKLREVPASN